MIGLHFENPTGRWWGITFLVLAIGMFAGQDGSAQAPPGTGQVSIPESSMARPRDTGVRAHTNIEIFIPNQGTPGGQTPPGKGGPGAAGSPASQPPVRDHVRPQ
jgi:hypothetical protein